MSEELKAKGEAILKSLAHIRELREKQERSWAELEQIAQIMLQGIDPEQIKGWVYDPMKDKGRHLIENRPTVYNVLHMKDGSVILLNPPIKMLPKES